MRRRGQSRPAPRHGPPLGLGLALARARAKAREAEGLRVLKEAVARLGANGRAALTVRVPAAGPAGAAPTGTGVPVNRGISPETERSTADMCAAGAPPPAPSPALDGLSRFLANAFCPTGPGGGVDPTCSPHGAKADAAGPGGRPSRPAGPWASEEAIREHAARMVAAHEADPDTRALRGRAAALEAEINRPLGDPHDPAGMTLTGRELNRRLEARAAARAELEKVAAAMEHNSRRSMLLSFSVPFAERAELRADAGPVAHHPAKNWREAADYLREITAKGGDGDVPVTVRATRGRAYYGFGQINTSKTDDPGVSAHEYGHHVEARSFDVQLKVARFRAGRFDPKDDVPMQKVAPYHGYDKDEVGNPDRMLDTFKGDRSKAAYAGKTYGLGSTEIVSMGLEQLYRDPVHFARADPHYFALVTGIIQGVKK